MCGRFSLIHGPAEVEDFFAVAGIEAFPPRYNIAPTQPVLVVQPAATREPGSNLPTREALLMRWGLLPAWVKDPKDFPLLINARGESAATKPSFRNAMRHRRCLIPASGFYEWKRDPQTKQSQAYWVRPVNGQIAAFGALCETYMGGDGAEIDTVAILTAEAGAPFSAIHNRIPVTIAPQDFDRWLDCKTQEPRHISDLLAPPPADFYEAIPVSDAVNKVANSDPGVQERVEPKQFVVHDPDRDSPQPIDAPDQGSLF